VGKRISNIPPALKHSAYSGATLLPGEDQVAFKKLHDGLIAEFSPVGPLEEDIVHTMARCVWRKQNLEIYRVAEEAKNRYGEISKQFGFDRNDSLPCLGFQEDQRSPEQIRAASEALAEEARKELGDTLELVRMGEGVSIKRLLEELSVLDRLDGMIDRCTKRLLLVRGAKSMSLSVPTGSADRRKRLSVA